MSLKNLALLVFTSALILSGCGGDKPPEQPVAKRLAFTVQPSQTVAGVAMAPAVQVTVQSAEGATIPGAQVTVSLALEANPAGGTLSGTTSAATSQGAATFSGLVLDKAGAGYTLVARAQGLESATSQAFTVTAAPVLANVLSFLQEPGELEAGSTFPSVVRVAVKDAAGNPVTASVPVTLALGANPAGGTLSGTLTANTADGVAAFPELSIDKVGEGYTLVVSAANAEPVTSAAFRVKPGKAKSIAFVTQPASSSVDVALTPAVQVRLLDARGNPATGATDSITLALGTNTTGATLGGTVTVAAIEGVATFADLSVDRVGTYTLAASGTGLDGATSEAFSIAAGAATRLAFSVQPTSATAGSTLTPEVEVTALDARGNVASFTGAVTVALAANPTGDTLQGTLTANAVAGVARFSTLSLRQAGTGYTLAASATGLTSATSAAFNVTPGEAQTLAFTTQPSSTVAGTAFNPAVAVTVRDAFGNTVTSSTATIQLALANNPSGAALAGTLSIAAVSGVASFPGISVNRVGTGYTLSASAQGLTTTSNAFDIEAGAAAQLTFSVQPSSVSAGSNLTPEVEVTAIDSQGNVATAFTGAVTVALAANPTSDTLQGTVTANAVAGVARFSTLSLRRAGTGYTLAASATGLTSATSQAFNVTPGEAQSLAFTTQPATRVAGTAFSPAVAVAVQDALGNTVTSSTATIQLALGNNPSSATLAGTLSVAAVNGVATFPGVSVDLTGTGYTLTASAADLTATSNAFNITTGPAARLAFGVQPSNVAAGSTITPAVTVRVVDAGGNTVTTATTSITVAFGNNPGVGILNGTKTASAVAGVATFSTLSVTRTGVGYTLTAAATGLTTGTSAAFNVTPGAATSLDFFTNAPNTVPAGAVITPAVRVGVRDSYGNTVTTSTAAITLSLAANPGSSTLGGTLTVNAVDGVAVFPDLTLNRSAFNYRFGAASPGLTSTTSALFNVAAGTANRLAFTSQPANVAAGATFSTSVRVTVQDALGNTVTSPAISVGMAIGNNPGGATLGGTATATTTNGVATFASINLDRVGTGYTLVASSGTLTGATSNAFNVTAGAATQLAFTVQPGNTSAGTPFDPAVQVSVRDSQGNTVTTATTSITLGFGNNPGGGSLSGTVVVSAVAGVATFPGVFLNRTGTGYTLRATATGLTAGTSAAFNVTAGAANRLAFSVQPARASVGLAMSPVQVAVQDSFGNVLTSATDSITLALGSSPSGATLSGTLTVSATNGVASFADLIVDAAGTGYTLTASADGLAGTTSAVFDAVIAGTRLVYTAPAPGRRIALVSNPASTATTVVLDLVAMEDLTGYSVGMNLPLDAERVQTAGSLMIPGAALPAGVNPTAAYGALPTSGPLAGVLTTGQSQKAAGEGAVATDSSITAGTVLYTVQLALRPGAVSGVVFDGAQLGPKFSALLRDKLGTDVVNGGGFAIGRLEVQ
ncbi:beta strand repeat-containing protein [Pyxidicoccus sp. 3LFB2]